MSNVTNFVLSTASDADGTNVTLTFGNATNQTDGQRLILGTTFHVIQTTGTFVATDVITSNISTDFTSL